MMSTFLSKLISLYDPTSLYQPITQINYNLDPQKHRKYLYIYLYIMYTDDNWKQNDKGLVKKQKPSAYMRLHFTKIN